MIDVRETAERLQTHVSILTKDIGERSVRLPGKLERTAAYIESFYTGIGLGVRREIYDGGTDTVANMVAEFSFSENPSRRYIVGAHYDSLGGTVGADDNASAVAVQLETARQLMALKGREAQDLPDDLSVVFVSFALEEPPAFGTRHMGSRVYAKKAKTTGEKIDGMICLEMVGYACHQPGCQQYPFPLKFLGYPEAGDFIGIVGNIRSRGLTRSLFAAFRKNPELPVIKLSVPLSGWLMPSVRLSDHASFWDQGFPAVMVTDTAFYRNPNYHLTSDTADTLDYRFMTELVKSLVVFFTSHRHADSP